MWKILLAWNLGPQKYNWRQKNIIFPPRSYKSERLLSRSIDDSWTWRCLKCLTHCENQCWQWDRSNIFLKSDFLSSYRTYRQHNHPFTFIHDCDNTAVNTEFRPPKRKEINDSELDFYSLKYLHLTGMKKTPLWCLHEAACGGWIQILLRINT